MLFEYSPFVFCFEDRWLDRLLHFAVVPYLGLAVRGEVVDVLPGTGNKTEFSIFVSETCPFTLMDSP